MNNLPPEIKSNSGQPTWHYAENGDRKGPVPQTTIERLIAEGVVTGETKLWTTGWPDWREANATEFSARLGTKPPSLPGDAIDNTWVWALAGSPLAYAVIVGLIQGNWLQQAHSSANPYNNAGWSQEMNDTMSGSLGVD
jgi:hypothetical protein